MGQIDQEIIVIGAGVAGLLAGRSLAEAGRAVTVIEARDRVGGRILTAHVRPDGARPIAIELGAEFIHGLPEETWTLVREARFPVFELQGSHVRYAHGRPIPGDAEIDTGGEVLRRMQAWASAQSPGQDASFAQFLASTRIAGREAQRAVRYVEGFNAAVSDRISVAALARQQWAEDSIQAERLFRFRDGYDALPAFLSTGFRRAGGQLLLEHIVRRIRWRPGSVTIEGTDRQGREFEMRARSAVIALPLGVLQSEKIEFAPSPGHALTHARRMAMGSVLRVTLVFRTRFWCLDKPDLADLSFLFSDDEMPGTWWTASPDLAPSLTGWVGGAGNVAAIRSRIDSGSGEGALGAYCLGSLARILGLDIRQLRHEFIGAHTHDWQGDEFSRGAYSYVPVGALDASARMAEPVGGCLFFAGEHTDTSGHWGTVHGALRSGVRAAQQILASSR
jgi:monoamine oxidase